MPAGRAGLPRPGRAPVPLRSLPPSRRFATRRAALLPHAQTLRSPGCRTPRRARGRARARIARRRASDCRPRACPSLRGSVVRTGRCRVSHREAPARSRLRAFRSRPVQAAACEAARRTPVTASVPTEADVLPTRPRTSVDGLRVADADRERGEEALLFARAHSDDAFRSGELERPQHANLHLTSISSGFRPRASRAIPSLNRPAQAFSHAHSPIHCRHGTRCNYARRDTSERSAAADAWRGARSNAQLSGGRVLRCCHPDLRRRAALRWCASDGHTIRRPLRRTRHPGFDRSTPHPRHRPSRPTRAQARRERLDLVTTPTRGALCKNVGPHLRHHRRRSHAGTAGDSPQTPREARART